MVHRVLWTIVLSLASPFAALVAQHREAATSLARVRIEVVNRGPMSDTTIVHSSGPGTWAKSIRLVEDWRISDEAKGEEYSFAFPWIMTVTPNGTLYVVDPPAKNVVRAYDSLGKYLRPIGRKGRGPGEFESVNGAVALPNGQLLVDDGAQHRMTIYATDGRVVRMWNMQESNQLGRPDLLQTDATGTIYRRVIQLSSQPRGPMRYPFTRMDTLGNIHDTIPAPTWPEEVMDMQRGPRVPEGYFTVDRSGRLVTGFGGRYVIEVRGPGSKVLRIDRSKEQPVPIPDGERDEYRVHQDYMRKNMPPGSMISGPAELPKVKPFFTDLIASMDGRIWVKVPTPSVENDVKGDPSKPAGRQPFRWSEPVEAWDVFDSKGTYLGQVRLKPKEKIKAVQGDRVRGTAEDENGVLSVVRWRLVH